MRFAHIILARLYSMKVKKVSSSPAQEEVRIDWLTRPGLRMEVLQAPRLDVRGVHVNPSMHRRKA
jgi:hypothetical protein